MKIKKRRVYSVYLVYQVEDTVKVSRFTKEMLTRVAARLQERLGRRVDLDEAIRHLLSSETRRVGLIDGILGSVREVTTEELHQERRLDERRAKRRHGY